MENEVGYFKVNKPSIIDLYALDDINCENIIENIKYIDESVFSNVELGDVKNNILHVKVTYKDSEFNAYLKIVDNIKNDLKGINKVLVENEKIEKANKTKKYIKSYIHAKHNYVKAYYVQLKLLALLTKEPLLIVDCTQWCIYSDKYIQHFLNNHVDIIDSNLFKIKHSNDGTLYTEGLERFGIKDVEMNGIEPEYRKACAAFLSRLSCYFIENGQLSNTCKAYIEVFEKPFYVCLVDIEFALEELSKRKLIKVKKRDESLNSNRLFISVHQSENMKTWYRNDEEVLEYLRDSVAYYTSPKRFNDERELAQKTVSRTIEILDEIDDLTNLMILAKNEEMIADWYYLSEYYEDKIILKTNDNSLVIDAGDVINWNYRGITPLYAYSLEI